jgi:hypothetical protein
VASLGQAVLEVKLDSAALTASLNQAKNDTTTALTGMERQTSQSTAKMAGSWREFVSLNLAGYRQMEGSHQAAMIRLGQDWKQYQATAQTAVKGVDAAVDSSTRSIGGFGSVLGRLGTTLSGLLAGGLVAGGIGLLSGQIAGLASEADNANKATASTRMLTAGPLR